MSNSRIDRVGVIGAGVMGSGIAAHLASCGYEVLLVDIVARDAAAAVAEHDAGYEHIRDERNGIAQRGLAGALKAKPALFQRPADAARVSVGNLEDDLADLGACDWIVEAVIERLDIKQSVFAKLDAHRKPDTIISSNTSGIPLAAMVEGRSEGFRKHFVITHFFNPVRYMKLLEIVSGPETDPAVTARMEAFCRDGLGKGVVFARDTINFIANRIGVHGMMVALNEWLAGGYRIEDVDQICGEAMARPKSAVFRTADVVGLDTFGHVARNCYDNLHDDEEHAVFELPAVLQRMIDGGQIGSKGKDKAGFYRKVGKQIMVLNPETLDYEPQEKTKFASVRAAKKTADLRERVKVLVEHEDRGGQYAWKVLSSSIVYAANRLGEIAGDVVSVDRAMRWGFSWQLGPFEIWDGIGVQNVVDRLQAEGRAIPKAVTDLLASGRTSFYGGEPGKLSGWTESGSMAAAPALPGIHIADVAATSAPIKKNNSAHLLDLGDGVLCLRFVSKMNALDAEILKLGEHALALCDAGTYKAIVIANDGVNFSVGANLLFIAMLAQAGDFKQLESAVATFQGFAQSLKYSKAPVVCAPHGMTLGGGCELAIHSSRMQAAAETYMGLVEVGVGLIPGAGGCKEMTVRALAGIDAKTQIDRVPLLQKSFEAIALAKVATGAGSMRDMGFLRDIDGWSVDGDTRVGDAKKVALRLVEDGYRPPLPPDNLILPGADGMAVFEMALQSFRWGGYASDHDVVVGRQVAKVLCGGERGGKLTEDKLLEIEREGFLHLCGLEKTQERIKHMLTTGKPLRN
jgi:3-hydroxyacyl-CoA dehydrogenase